jgi:uncharacterized protein YlaI
MGRYVLYRCSRKKRGGYEALNHNLFTYTLGMGLVLVGCAEVREEEKMRFNKCPYCNKVDCVDERVFRHSATYGGGFYDVMCVHCGKMIQVYTEQQIRVIAVEKSDRLKEDADYQ